MKKIQTTFTVTVVPHATAPRVSWKDAIPLGSFRIPADTSAQQPPGIGQNRPSMYYNKRGNNGKGSLFIWSKQGSVGSGIPGPPNYPNAVFEYMAEITIPVLKKGVPVSQLNRASFCTPGYVSPTSGIAFREPSEGKAREIYKDGLLGNPVFGGGIVAKDDYLYFSECCDYDTNASQHLTHFRRPRDLSVTGSVVGPYGFHSSYISTHFPTFNLSNRLFGSTFMCDIPPEWQQRLGGSVILTGMPGSGKQSVSAGPNAFVWDPSRFSNKQEVKPLLWYPPLEGLTLAGGPTTGPDPRNANTLWNWASHIHGGVLFPKGSRSLIFFGVEGTSTGSTGFLYGNADPVHDPPVPKFDVNGDRISYDPIQQNKGQHAYPYLPYSWEYDVEKLLPTIADPVSNPPYLARPYQYGDISNTIPYVANWPVVGNPNSPFKAWDFTGNGYDPDTQRVFLALTNVENNAAIVIAVYQLPL